MQENSFKITQLCRTVRGPPGGSKADLVVPRFVVRGGLN